MTVSLSDAQIAKCKKYFRASGMSNDSTTGIAGDALFNQATIILETHCRSLQNEEIKAEVVDVLTKLDSIYEKIFASSTRFQVNQVSDIKLDPREETRLRDLFEEYKADLAGMLRVEHMLGTSQGGYYCQRQY